jgi:hypothetical protein
MSIKYSEFIRRGVTQVVSGGTGLHDTGEEGNVLTSQSGVWASLPPANACTIVLPVPVNIPVINGYTVVAMDNSQLVIADNTDFTLINKVIGITKNSATTGQDVTIATSGGELTGLAALTVGGKVYLSTSGAITQTVPSNGFIIQLGVALTATTVSVNITSAIQII